MEKDKEVQGPGGEDPKRSLGSVLDEIGFKPLGRRVVIKKGVDCPPLKNRGNYDADKER